MDANGPPPPFEDRGQQLVIASCILHGFSLPVLLTRIWSRSYPNLRLGWDDWAIMAAATFDLIQWILILVAVSNGLGRPSYYVPPAERPIARACLYFANHCSGWVICLAKLSIAYSLYRLRRDSTVWRVFLMGMMVLPVAIAVTTSGFLFAACRPLSAMWEEPSPNSRPVCLPFSTMSQGILATATLTVITDFVLALLPITFINRIKRSVRERAILAVIMGLGIIASAASICKIISVSSKQLTGDPLRDGVDVTFWGIMEVELGIIAACVPFIRRTVEQWFIRLGVFRASRKRRRGGSFYHMEDRSSSTGTGTGTWVGPRSQLEHHGAG